MPKPPLQPSLTSYDAVPYPASAHPQTHPESLAVIGALFGMQPAPATGCRVLELGCSNGSNLVPMAAMLPNSEFVGIDLAQNPVRQGQQMVADLGLNNIRLVPGDLTGIDGTWGRFDYILAHGIYSWVPKEVRHCVLSICRERLNPQGIAFISYNAYPGGHARNMTREMMRFHVRGIASPEERISQAVALARFLAESVARQDPYRIFMGGELDTVLKHERNHLYHDELAEVNESFYFAQFIEQAASHDLQYLGEADYFEMFDHGFSEETRKTLAELSSSRLLREQYLDFLKCRRFRQTLLCHREAALKPAPFSDPVLGFLVRSHAESATLNVDLRPGVPMKYRTTKGGQCDTDYPLGKAALWLLSKAWPGGIGTGQLHQEALAALRERGLPADPSDESAAKLGAFLLQLFGAGIVQFHTFLPPVPSEPGSRPVVYPVARWQAKFGDVVTTMYNAPARLEDEIALFLVRSLDGSLSREAIADQLWNLLKEKGALEFPPGGEADARRKITAKLEENLRSLATIGLIVR